MALTRLKSVVGVGIPDTELCNAAVDLLQACSPEFLCTHCLRTYIFGSLAVRSIGRSIVDEEAAFCGAARRSAQETHREIQIKTRTTVPLRFSRPVGQPHPGCRSSRRILDLAFALPRSAESRNQIFGEIRDRTKLTKEKEEMIWRPSCPLCSLCE